MQRCESQHEQQGHPEHLCSFACENEDLRQCSCSGTANCVLHKKGEGRDQLCQSHQLWQPFLHMQYLATYSSAMRHVLNMMKDVFMHMRDAPICKR